MKVSKKIRLHAAFEKRADLFTKTLRAINATSRRFITANAERPHAPGNINVFAPRCLHCDLSRGAIDLRDAAFEPKSFQPHRVRAKSVRFNHPRACANILLVDRLNPIRFRHTQLFETTLERDPRLQKQSPDRSVSAENARLKFIEQVHP